MTKWFQREIKTEKQTETRSGTHKRQSIRDLHRELKKAGLGASGSVTMHEQADASTDPVKTLIHQAEVTRRGRVKVLEL